MTNKLKEERAGVYIYGVFLMLAIVIVAAAFMEYFRIYGTVGMVEKAYEKAMLSVAIENYDDIFTTVREGTQIGGMFDGGNETRIGSIEKPVWVCINDFGDILEELIDVLQIEYDGETAIVLRDNAGSLMYRISDLKMNIAQAGSYDDIPIYEINGSFDIELPVYFCGRQLFVFDTTVLSKAAWKSRV